MEIKENLKTLSNAVCIGDINEASVIAEKLLSPYCETEISGKTVKAQMGSGKDYTILIDAHIDEVGMVVTDIDDGGFVTVAKCGGIDLRHISAKPVIIHGKEDVTGVFISTPPHLSSDDAAPDDIGDIKIDPMLGARAKEIISIGDYVTYSTAAFDLSESTVCGKSLDNRAGVACIIELARRLYGKELPANVIFLLSDAEELGLRGIKTSAYGIDTSEAVVLDVSFGDGPDIPPLQCGKMRGGAMIGVCPLLNRDITETLNCTADENNIPYQNEIMGRATSTNADILAVTKSGIKTGLVSIPLRNMHTDTEIVDLSDLESVCDILEKYILSGGIKNV